MKIIQKKINLIESQIHELEQLYDNSFLITEMKKIGIEKLPYSYSALKQFIDSETMNVHYNKHYKGYVNKLNAALSKKKFGDLDLEQIVKSISKFDDSVRNNAGGAYNHALFWKMLSPKPTKPGKLVSARIETDFGGLPSLKKKFNERAKEKFGSGWIWLVVTKNNRLKIVTSNNQDNPLMNDFENGGYPILGLDLWEHAYYLKYRNNRDEYIKNFWSVVNWGFVEKLYKMKVDTKLNESIILENLVENEGYTFGDSTFCSSSESSSIKSILFDNNENNELKAKNKESYKSVISTSISDILRNRFASKWREETKTHMSGLYHDVGNDNLRSLLNNLTSNYMALCQLHKEVNLYLNYSNQPTIEFEKGNYEKNISSLRRLFSSIDDLRNQVFNTGSGITNRLGNILKYSDCLGKRTEDASKQIIEQNYGNGSCKLTSGLGLKVDAFKGKDCEFILDGELYSAQIKPFTSIVADGSSIKVLGASLVKEYGTDCFVFTNVKEGVTQIFKNKGVRIISGNYVFPESSHMDSLKASSPLELIDCKEYLS